MKQLLLLTLLSLPIIAMQPIKRIIPPQWNIKKITAGLFVYTTVVNVKNIKDYTKRK